MSLELIASGSLASAMPGVASLHASFSLTIDRELAAATLLLAELQAELPEIQANLEASLSVGLELQATIANPLATIAASIAYAAEAQISLAADIASPEFALAMSAQLNAQLAVTAELTAKVALRTAAIAAALARIEALKAAAKLVANFSADLGVASVRVYLYRGPLGDLGLVQGSDGMTATTFVQGAIVVTNSPTSFETLKRVFNLVVA